MKHLTILVPRGQNNLSSVIGPYKIFCAANNFSKQTRKKEVFKIQVAGVSGTENLYGGLFSIHPEVKATDIRKTHLIIIPSLSFGDYPLLIKKNHELSKWIKEQYKKGAEIASICSGAFLLAASGLLNNKNCSTHWMVEDTFKEMFPGVRMVTDKILTDEHRLYTNGGAFSFLNLVLYLVEKYYDRETAIYCSKVFQIDISRHSQSPFTMFKGQKNHNDELIKRAQLLIEQSFSELTTIDDLAKMLSLSRRNFDRRFMKATGNSPFEYQQRVKIEVAKKAFEISGKTPKEVMYLSGYSEMKVFREAFKKVTGITPLEYRDKFGIGMKWEESTYD
ncbi:MAG: helix-turn-helix domain-containing protein [Chitinophagaceae bacterium]|nr:MAG: helix-turn-helix domain-containing protein [Chitinophagaceae bacterium]